MNNPVTPARWHCKGLCKSLVLFYMFHVNKKKKKKKKKKKRHEGRSQIAQPTRYEPFCTMDMDSQYLHGLPADARARCEKKLAISDLKCCPYLMLARSWINNPIEWPEVDYGDVYPYLVETPGNFC